MGSSESHLRWALYEQPIYQMDGTQSWSYEKIIIIKHCVSGDWMIFYAATAGPSRVTGHACDGRGDDAKTAGEGAEGDKGWGCGVHAMMTNACSCSCRPLLVFSATHHPPTPL